MRSLVLTLNAPIAANGGAGLRNEQTVRSLARHGPVDVVSLAVTQAGVVDGAASLHTWSWDELRASQTSLMRYRQRAWPVRIRSHWRQDMYQSPVVEANIRRLVAEHDHELVVIAAWQLGGYVADMHGQRAVVFDAHNVEADLGKQVAPEADRAIARLMTALDGRRVQILEGALGAWVNQVWTCSDEDAELWRRIHGAEARVRVVPNTVARPDPLPGERQRGTSILLTGTFSYPPNIQAATELVREVFPLVRRELPNATVDLVGREPADEVLALHASDRGVNVVGAVPDMHPYLDRSLALVVPLRAGGGTRLKILEAMAAGLPVVSTPKGAEGIRATPGEHLVIGHSVADLASVVIRIHREPAWASNMAAAARALVAESYGEAALDDAIDQAVDELGLL